MAALHAEGYEARVHWVEAGGALVDSTGMGIHVHQPLCDAVPWLVSLPDSSARCLCQMVVVPVDCRAKICGAGFGFPHSS